MLICTLVDVKQQQNSWASASTWMLSISAEQQRAWESHLHVNVVVHRSRCVFGRAVECEPINSAVERIYISNAVGTLNANLPIFRVIEHIQSHLVCLPFKMGIFDIIPLFGW